MGRPFGSPNQPEFQTSVLKHVLKLLEAPKGPILEDFPKDAPDMKDQPAPVTQLVCPISFDAGKEHLSETERLLESFAEEFSQMKTWYEKYLTKNGRTTVGISGLSPEEARDLMTTFIRNEKSIEISPELSIADTLRMAIEDIKALYFEAVSAQPGQPTDSRSLAEWFWGKTAAAQVINEIRKISLQKDTKEMKLLGKLLLIPRNQLYRFEK
ncbi:MAG: hypothetical protein U9N63_16150 [Pseudomonadota bacterium]|nr:hypothetical protein [Pseudomonadota bacterium]